MTDFVVFQPLADIIGPPLAIGFLSGVALMAFLFALCRKGE